VVVQDVAVQGRTEVAAGHDVSGQGGEQDLPAGRLPTGAAVARGAGLQDQVLDDIVLVALETGARGRVVQADGDLAMDGESGVLGALGRARALAVRRAGLLGRCLQGAGSDRGPRLETFEGGQFIFEQGEAVLLLVEEVEQQQDEGSTRAFGDVGDRQPHTRIVHNDRSRAAASPRLIEKLQEFCQTTWFGSWYDRPAGCAARVSVPGAYFRPVRGKSA